MGGDGKKIPEGRLGRLARMAGVGLRSGASLLVSKEGDSAAKHAAEVFGTLRGLAAKVGQMASYVDGVVPEKHRDAYETAMKGLRAAAPTSSPTEVRRLVEEELGGPVDRLFSEWNDVPIASASVGQVHRATTLDGIEVAVKVQHPGIVKAIEADLANAGMMGSFASMVAGRRFDVPGQIAVIKQRFREELDYELEAERIRAFAEIHAGDPHIRILELIDDRSSKRVLTTRFVDGIGYDAACEAPVAERRLFAETMWRFVFKGNLVGGMFNADPHPGNYLFHENGDVTFLDFGCVQRIDPDKQNDARRMHRAAIDGEMKAFREGAIRMIGMKPGKLSEASLEYTRLCFRPLFERPFHMTREYAADLLVKMKDLAHVAKGAKDEEFFTMPTDVLFINRLQFGFYSVLARLDVEVDYAAVEESFWPEVEAAEAAAE